MKGNDTEVFKPVPVRRTPGLLGSVLFTLRMAVDLQLLTCVRFLAPHLACMRGPVLDVGCGEMPFRTLLGSGALYTGIDILQSGEFGMCRHADVVQFDGQKIPFPDASFDCVLCTEVLEHAEDPVALIAEMYRVLRPGGLLVATVPFSARVHHVPYDYHRFSRFRLVKMFEDFAAADVQERGTDLAVIANKLIVLCVRLIRPPSSVMWLWRLPILALLTLPAAAALAVAHLSLVFGWGDRLDPLGYSILARKAA